MDILDLIVLIAIFSLVTVVVQGLVLLSMFFWTRFDCTSVGFLNPGFTLSGLERVGNNSNNMQTYSKSTLRLTLAGLICRREILRGLLKYMTGMPWNNDH